MRTRIQPTPKDPKCRPWGAYEAARRKRQIDHGYRVGISTSLERRAATFRAEKLQRAPAQREADKRSAEENRKHA